MSIQNKQRPGTGDTVSMTVVITQEARGKLRRIKGLLGCSTLDDTVTKAIELVDMRDVFEVAMESDGIEIGSFSSPNGGD